jgi:anti-sigma factor ChrR (cupin superfamily)
MTTEHRCFCELAPLYVLNVLDADDRAWVEAQIATDADLAMELAELEAIANTICYATPPINPAADLKQRLFQRIGRDLPWDTTSATAATAIPSATEFPAVVAQLLQRSTTPPTIPANGELSEPMTDVPYASVRWKPHPRAERVMIARLHVDPVKREVVLLLRAEPHMQYPLHFHANIEEIFMLQGDLIIGDRVYGSGDYIRSVSGSGHAPYSRTGCMFFARTSLDDEYPQAVEVGG